MEGFGIPDCRRDSPAEIGSELGLPPCPCAPPFAIHDLTPLDRPEFVRIPCMTPWIDPQRCDDGAGVLDREAHRRLQVGRRDHLARQVHLRDELKVPVPQLSFRRWLCASLCSTQNPVWWWLEFFPIKALLVPTSGHVPVHAPVFPT